MECSDQTVLERILPLESTWNHQLKGTYLVRIRFFVYLIISCSCCCWLHLSVYLSVYLSYLSVNLSIYLFTEQVLRPPESFPLQHLSHSGPGPLSTVQHLQKYPKRRTDDDVVGNSIKKGGLLTLGPTALYRHDDL